MVEVAVDPVDEEIGEEHEEGELEDVVGPERCVVWVVVEFCVTFDFAEEEGHRQDGHDG